MPNERYEREKYIAALLGMHPVFASGGTDAGGFEDMQTDEALGQSKTTWKPKLPVELIDLLQLRAHAGTRIPLYAFDFERVTLPNIGIITNEIWVATYLPLHIEMFDAWLEKHGRSLPRREKFLV